MTPVARSPRLTRTHRTRESGRRQAQSSENSDAGARHRPTVSGRMRGDTGVAGRGPGPGEEPAQPTMDGVMHIDRVLLQHTPEGWAVKRPGWPSELTASREWAECLADSLAYEAHEISGRPVCVVLAGTCGEKVLRRFG